ncbi:DUF11 domain-containing protein [Cellulomonas triticagri]|uniref:DUF11 domain-containing protein n=1 Tax=Cellulomonas triticagri TaxID=2483352 RepID=A0A3M2JFT7_9CELL|nr:DUF11 domain-containing protein [Cellulomonas triticagri]
MRGSTGTTQGPTRTRPPGRRRAAALTGVLLLAALVPGPVAVAAPVDDCQTPDRVVTASTSGTSLSVAAGEVVTVAGGTQTGGVDALPAGGTLCVAAGATLAPAYVNNAAGTVYVAPGATATMPSIAVNQGFVLDNAGTATFAGLALNGPSTVTNAAGATLTVTGSFQPGAGTITNAGTMAFPGGATLNAGVTLVNDGALTASALTVNGPFQNAGRADVTGDLTVNGSGTLTNLCVLTSTGGLTHNGTGSSNTGLVALGGGFANQGSWRQNPTGTLTATTLLDNGTVTGFGRYVFSGATQVQGGFDGDSAWVPVFVDAPGGVFPGSGAGSVTNVDVRTLAVDGPDDFVGPDCADPAAPPSADVRVSKTGPASVDPGGVVTYTITVVNAGPDPAAGVVVTDTLPAELTGVTASGGGVVAPPTVTWSLGTLAVGATATLTVSGTAPVPDPGTEVTLVNTVSATATTDDPDPSNNDGSADSETVLTDVVADPDDVDPPVAQDLVREGYVNRPIISSAIATSPDPDLRLRYTQTSDPDEGADVMLPNGLFGYVPPADFVGTTSFTYQACDNQPVPLCDTATITLVVHPRAVGDEVTTLMGQPVTIDVLANDPGGAALQPTSPDGPDHGGLSAVDPAAGTIEYTPGANYLGTDQFVYEVCGPAVLPSPLPGAGTPDCTTAPVVVHVVPDNSPPVAPLLAMETSVGTPVTGTPAVSDPDPGDTTTLTSAFEPVRDGTASVTTVTTTYTPPPGFAGRDLYQYTVCDDGYPVLCATGLVTVLVDPVAADDSATTPAGTPVTIDVAANDVGTVLPPDVTSGPANGTVALVDGLLVYTPAPGFSGTDTFTYQVCASDVSPACDTATVTVLVVAPVDPVDPGTGGGTGGGAGTGGTGTGSGPGGDVLAVTGTESAPLGAAALGLLALGGALSAAGAAARRRLAILGG